jgi:hypothetical protein
MIYTRENPDPNPTEPMNDPEKILHGTREQVSDPFYYLDKILSLPKDGVQSIEDLEFDEFFEQTLFRYKSETSLDETVFDPKKFQALISNNIPQNLNPPRAMAARFAPSSCRTNYMTCLRIIARELGSTTLKEMFLPRGTCTSLMISST